MVLLLAKDAHRRQRLAVVGAVHHHDTATVALYLEHITQALLDGLGPRDHVLDIAPMTRHQVTQAFGQGMLQRMHATFRNPGHAVQLVLHLLADQRVAMADNEHAIAAGTVDEPLAGMVGNVDTVSVLLDTGLAQAIELGGRGTPVALAIVQQLLMRQS